MVRLFALLASLVISFSTLMAVEIPADGSISNAALSNDGHLLAVATTTSLRKDKKIFHSTEVKLSDVSTGVAKASRVVSSQVSAEPISSAQRRQWVRPHFIFFTPDDKKLLVYDGGSDLRVLNAQTLEQESTLPLSLPTEAVPIDMQIATQKPVMVALIAPNGADLQLQFVDYEQGKTINSVQLPRSDWSYGTALAVDDDGSQAAVSLRYQKKIAVYRQGEQVRYIPAPVALGSIAFGPSDSICGGPLSRIDVKGEHSDGALCLSASDGHVLKRFKSDDGAVYDRIVINKDRKLLAGLVLLGKHDQEGFPERPAKQIISIWDMSTGRVLWRSESIEPVLIHHPSFVLSRDGDKIAIFTKGFAGVITVEPVKPREGLLTSSKGR